MPTVVHIPHMGEGLQEARIIRFLKQPGERVQRDEPICEIETDKAIMDLESVHEGTLVAWHGKEGESLAIGAPIATIESATVTTPSHNEPDTTQKGNGLRNADLPPRIQRYLKDKGLLGQQDRMPRAQAKLTVEDIDRFLAAQTPSSCGSTAPVDPDRTGDYEDVELSPAQQILASHLMRASRQAVAASVSVDLRWSSVLEQQTPYNSNTGPAPSPLARIAKAVVQAMGQHPNFRCTISGEKIRRFRHINFGIAVTLPNDDLGTAVIEQADRLTHAEWGRAVKAAIKRTVKGESQPVDRASVIITDLSRYGVLQAQPVLVPPAVAVVFIGAPTWKMLPQMGGTVAHREGLLTLTFDHRLINGVGAARFLRAVKAQFEREDSMDRYQTNGHEPDAAEARSCIPQ